MILRLAFVCSAVFALFVGAARAEGNYQNTRDGKTLVWNDQPKPGDEATWSGRRDRDGYAHGFGTLVWYTKEPGVDKPQLYALYWGNMVQGKLNGLVNLHSKKRTHHALFASGARLTRWTPGPARSRMTTEQMAMLEKHNATVSVGEPELASEKRSVVAEPGFAERAGVAEPEAPAVGPSEERSEVSEQRSESMNFVQDLVSERRPKIDIDDSLRLLAFPPRTLRKVSSGM